MFYFHVVCNQCEKGLVIRDNISNMVLKKICSANLILHGKKKYVNDLVLYLRCIISLQSFSETAYEGQYGFILPIKIFEFMILIYLVMYKYDGNTKQM